ncbi:MAG: patatin-like phospholipase family protein [Nitrospira sp.]|nr:patatin-like phospholipase family protein [Nitrospira sp.]
MNNDSLVKDEGTQELESLRQRANNLLRGEKTESPDAFFHLAKIFANSHQDMGYACRLAAYLIQEEQPVSKPLELRQKWAMWTSKNPDLPDDTKHDDALHILKEMPGDPLATTLNAETLGIAGGICKRKWMVDGQLDTLETALAYYERGVAQGVVHDNGYTAINAAFVHDLLWHLRNPGDQAPCSRARMLREEILAALLPLEEEPAWEQGPRRRELRWFHETIAEAHFGLRQYEKAILRLRGVYEQEVPAWEYETTARQMAWVARLLAPEVITQDDYAGSPVWAVLREVYGHDAEALAGSLFAGKLGLALSGGGFRASFYHLGVLAALAEMDLLRHIEALSCVSGGSIVGAAYYLEIKKLLEGTPGRINQDEYLEAVNRVAQTFLAGVQTNIRTRVFSNIFDNLRMIFQPGFSPTVRLGNLYQKYLFGKEEKKENQEVRATEAKQPVRLQDLLIQARSGVTGPPKYINWRRQDKIPILILNATTANTGHNWQFTASWMGEPPSQIATTIDNNYRLRRMYLANEAPGTYRDFPFCQAVAASSCVPGLFTPLQLIDLYEDVTVHLVDGGVYDNQGTGGLLDQNCSVVIVSDGSGQLASQNHPTDAPLGVLARSNAITMGSVRAQQYDEMVARRNSGRLKGLAFLHLKQELESHPVDWVDCSNPKQLSNQQLRKASQQLTNYGVMKSSQEKIAHLRTDLDAFSDTEAYALMYSGYAMANLYIPKEIQGFQTNHKQYAWDFLAIAPQLKTPGSEAIRTERLLKVGSQQAFKIWRLSPVLTGVAGTLGLVALVTLIWAAFFWTSGPSISFQTFASLLLAGILGSVGLDWILKVLDIQKSFYQILTWVGLCIVGAVGAWIHLGMFNPWFLRQGKVRRNTLSQ